jgi:hypothetical protein
MIFLAASTPSILAPNSSRAISIVGTIASNIPSPRIKSDGRENYNASRRKIIKFSNEFRLQDQRTTIKSGKTRPRLMTVYLPTYASSKNKQEKTKSQHLITKIPSLATLTFTIVCQKRADERLHYFSNHNVKILH